MDLSFIGHILQPFAKNDKKLFWHFFTLLKKETSFDYNLEAVQDIYKKIEQIWVQNVLSYYLWKNLYKICSFKKAKERL